ncbi:MAG: histidine--tRNA ligase, partial [Acidobacteriota bacterium]
MASTNPARGMRDFLPADVRKRNYVIGIIKEVYESYGFEPLETPAVENLETLMGKYGEEGHQLVFKILKRGEKLDLDNAKTESDLSDLALRYDLTVPLARVVANNKNDLPKFFKRYQIQPVWRADRPARGRFREFYQCDVDAIGSSSIVIEAELISAVSEIMRRLGFNDFIVRVNNRKLLAEILDVAGVSRDKHPDALIALDKLDKIGREGVTKEFNARGLSNSASEKLLVFFESLIKSNIKDVVGKSAMKRLIELKKRLTEKEDSFDTATANAERIRTFSVDVGKAIDDILRQLDEKNLDNSQAIDIKDKAGNLANLAAVNIKRARMRENLNKAVGLLQYLSTDPHFESVGVDELWELIKPIHHDLLKSSPSSVGHVPIVLDPTLARGLSYYTGTIMEINVPDLAGSLGGGGRYDGLIGMFGKEQIPACGFSLGLERILVVMEERGMFPPEIAESTPADVMVTIWSEETVGESLKLANELRAQKIRVTVYPEP